MTANAFIPLKGHSERVPGKNMRDFAGRPLFHAIVSTLQRAASVGTIYIDTDSDEIAASAASLTDVMVIRRDPALVGDDVSVNLLIRAFLDNYPGDVVVQTHATNPLLQPETIDRAVATFRSEPAVTSLFTVTRFQGRFYHQNLAPVNHDPAELIPTQDLEPVFLENSNLYVFSREGFFESDRRITDRTRMLEVDPIEAIDIDDEADFRMAQAAKASNPLA